MTARVYVNLSDFKLFSVMQKIGFYPAILLAPRFPPPDHFEHLGLQLAMPLAMPKLLRIQHGLLKNPPFITSIYLYHFIPGRPFVLEKSGAN